MVKLGGKYYPDDGAVQLLDELGNLFTAYDDAEPAYQYRDGPFIGAAGVEIPDLSSMLGIAVECRNERYFAMAAKAIGQASGDDVWVVDGDGVVWPATKVDLGSIKCR